MVGEESTQMQNPWIESEPEQSSGVEFDGRCVSLISESMVVTEGIEVSNSDSQPHSKNKSGRKLGFPERAFSTTGAAFLSAILVNPLDVAKMFTDLRCSPSYTRAGIHGTVSICPPDCFQYKGTLDIFYKIIRQEGFARLWRSTNAGLALAVPTVGIYLPCYDIFLNYLENFTAKNAPSMTPYAPLLAGSLARLLAYAFSAELVFISFVAGVNPEVPNLCYLLFENPFYKLFLEDNMYQLK